jgi:nucleoid-associated protein YgaU
MALDNLFKLEKLTIGVYRERERPGLPPDTFEVMFNPESFSMRHESAFDPEAARRAGRQVYVHTPAQSLSLELIIDGTGVSDYGLTNLLGLGSQSVSEQVTRFLDLCWNMDGELHEPRFLRIQWGDGPIQNFNCRLQSVDITYSSFARSGAPLRAKLSTVFVEDLDAARRVRLQDMRSPDLSRTRIVKSGDTLPLLCKEIYGSSRHYLRVARWNQMNDFRNLTPGQEIRFPPLEPGKR